MERAHPSSVDPRSERARSRPCRQLLWIEAMGTPSVLQNDPKLGRMCTSSRNEANASTYSGGVRRGWNERRRRGKRLESTEVLRGQRFHSRAVVLLRCLLEERTSRRRVLLDQKGCPTVLRRRVTTFGS